MQVCFDCVREEYLISLIKTQSEGTCDFCYKKNLTISIDYLSKIVIDVLGKYYALTPSGPNEYEQSMQRDRESDYCWYREGQPILEVITEMLEVDELIAKEIFEVLPNKSSEYEPCAEEEHDESAHYMYSDKKDQMFNNKWDELVVSIKHEFRFLNYKAQMILDDIFDDIENFQTHDNEPVTVKIKPNSKQNYLYRARLLTESDMVEKVLKSPDVELSAPPSHLAPSGRMNPRGISFFYGALEQDTAISEVRPYIGSYVVVGKFNLLRDIELIDLTSFEHLSVMGSIFDPKIYLLTQRALFLKEFSKIVSMPVHPHEIESEYLPTQIVAEYLSKKFDGMIFSSSQSSKSNKNVVLFHHASKVKSIDNSMFSTVNVNMFDQDDGDFWISVSKIGYDPLTRGAGSIIEEDTDSILEVDIESLTVQVIDRVRYNYTQHAVSICEHFIDEDDMF